MAYDGSGTFVRTNGVNTGSGLWQADRDAGTKILASRHDVQDQDIANGLSNAICKDGQTTPTANIPFGGFKLTNVGAGTARTDAARVSQIQDGAPVYAGTTAGSSNDYTATLTPAISAYTTGMMLSFKADRANTGASTFNVNSVAATAIRKYDGTTALAANDILSGQTYIVQHNGTFWILLNPSAPNFAAATVAGLTTTNTLTVNSTSTLTGAVTNSSLTASTLLYSSAAKVITSTSPAISTWTPAATANGSMTATGDTVYSARYFQIGPFIHFFLGIVFTIGGTPDTSIYISVPVAGTAHNVNLTFACAANDGGGSGISDARWRYDGTQIIVFKAGLSNWSSGANAAVFIDGKYEI